jgi:hypothetical protein
MPIWLPKIDAFLYSLMIGGKDFGNLRLEVVHPKIVKKAARSRYPKAGENLSFFIRFSLQGMIKIL